MNKYIIKVNAKGYHSYKEMCVDLDVDFKAFMKVKCENPEMDEMDLLGHFFNKVYLKMSDGSYVVDNEPKK